MENEDGLNQINDQEQIQQQTDISVNELQDLTNYDTTNYNNNKGDEEIGSIKASITDSPKPSTPQQTSISTPNIHHSPYVRQGSSQAFNLGNNISDSPSKRQTSSLRLTSEYITNGAAGGGASNSPATTPIRSSALGLGLDRPASKLNLLASTHYNSFSSHSSSNRSLLLSVPNPVIPKTVHAAYMRRTRRSFPSSAAEAKLRHGDMFYLMKATHIDKFSQQSKNEIFGIEMKKKKNMNNNKAKLSGNHNNEDHLDDDMEDDTQFSEGLLGRVQDLNRAFRRPIYSFTTDDLQRLQGINVGIKSSIESAQPWIREASTRARRNKPRYIPWESMPLDRIIKTKKPCIWIGEESVSEIKSRSANISRQFKDLEKYFPPIDPDKVGTFVSVLTGKEMTKSTLDAKRATTLSIVMKRMGIKKTRFPKIAWSFREMDESFLTRENIDIFQLNYMWPSNEELRILKNRINAGKELAEPDQFLWYIGITVPDIAIRVAAMAFKYEFEDNVEGIMTACATIDVASKELMASRMLKKFLRIIVLIGNKINNQAKPLPPPTPTAIVKKPPVTMTFTGIRAIPPPPAPKAPLAVHPETVGAKAITLESLLKLSSIKSPVDKSITVLDCIAKYMEENAPELLEISSFLMCTPEAAKYDLSEQRKFLREARSGLQKIRLIPKMIDFYAEASGKLDEIEKTTKRAEKSFQEVLLYFGYDNDAMESSNFFGQLKEFLNTFDAAVEKLSKSEEESNADDLNSMRYTPILNKLSMSNARKSIFGGFGVRNSVDNDDNSSQGPPPQIRTGRKSIFGRPR